MDSQAEADAEWERQEEAYRLEQEAERAAWLAEQPEAIDYVACHYQEGWL
jgi:aminoglycoside phosphotransferase